MYRAVRLSALCADGRIQPLDLVDIRHIHLMEQPAGVR
jgi:hypothetical protein